MTITRERQPHHPERQAGGGAVPMCWRKTGAGLRREHRGDAGRGGIKDLTGALAPVFLQLYVL